MNEMSLVTSGLRFSRYSFRVCNVLALSSVLWFASCSKDNGDDNNNNNGNTGSISDVAPKGAKPAWGPDITAQMQTVIEKIEQLSDTTPIHFLTVDQARTAPSAADAALAVQADFKIPAPAANSDTTGVEIPVSGGTIHARIFTPRTGKSSYPVIVYYHGGGFVLATIDTYKSSAQALAEKTDAIVVSVEYRKAPEYTFPTAHDDAYAAYTWVLSNAATFKGDTSKVAVAGESAGGNLAAATSMKAAQMNVKVPVYQVLVYPVANNDTTTASATMYKDAVPLGRSELTWFYEKYTPDPAQGNDPRISLVDVADLSKMPPTTIIAAELDPLQTEGKLLADKLASLGISSDYKLYPGVTHEFFGMNTVVQEAIDAENYAADKLKTAFK